MVTSKSSWLGWFRGLPRASVLVFCTVALAAVQSGLAALGAAAAIRIGAAVVIAAVAAASELDKLHTRRLEVQPGAGCTAGADGQPGGVDAGFRPVRAVAERPADRGQAAALVLVQTHHLGQLRRISGGLANRRTDVRFLPGWVGGGWDAARAGGAAG